MDEKPKEKNITTYRDTERGREREKKISVMWKIQVLLIINNLNELRESLFVFPTLSIEMNNLFLLTYKLNSWDLFQLSPPNKKQQQQHPPAFEVD